MKIITTNNPSSICEEIKDLLIKQIAHELENHSAYRNFALYFELHGLSLLCTYYEDRAKEEYIHHEWIYNYLKDVDPDFIYPEITKQEFVIQDHIFVFEKTVEIEKETTALLEVIVNKAQDIQDWKTFNFLMSEDKLYGKLIREQIEEETISQNVLDIANQDASWLRKEKAISELYNESR